MPGSERTTGAGGAADTDRADVRLAAGRLGEEELGALARQLAVAHAAAAVDSEAARHAGPAALAARTKTLVAEAERVAVESAAAVREVAALQERFLARHADWLEARIDARRVRCGVASPRLTQLWIADDGGVVVADAEGAEAPRDVCAAVAGPSLGLASRGHSELAERLLAAYADESDDYALYRVVDFHERDGACARALGAARRTRDPHAPISQRERDHADVRRYLQLARATARRPLLPPAVVVVGGLVASGKSTLARAVASRLAAPRVVGDHVREFVEGAAPGRPADVAQRLEGFAPEVEDSAYRALFESAAAVLDSGRPVVLDGGFPTAVRRRAARALAKRCGVPFRFVECRVAADVVHRRLAERDAAAPVGAGGWQTLYAAYEEKWEPPDEISPDERLALDTARPLEVSVADVAGRLPLWPEGHGE
jgi:hypothetical protein